MVSFQDCGFGEFDARRRIGPARWDRFDLFWLHSGQVEMRLLDRDPVELSAGQGLLIYPDTPFVGRSLAPVSRASVQHFRLGRGPWPTVLRRLRGRRGGFERCAIDPPDALERDFERAVRLSQCRQTALVRSLREAQLTLILGQLAVRGSAGSSADARALEFEKLTDWLSRHTEEPVRLEEMAKRVGLSVSHFRARFRARYGVSPGRYAGDLRMRRAAALLRETALPIKTVAQRLGYPDLPNFYRAFRAATGRTPAEHRRLMSPRG